MGIHSRPLLLKNFSSFLFYIINLAIVFIGPYYFAIVGVIVFAFFFYPQWNSKFDMFYTATEENKKRIEKCPSIKLVIFSYLNILKLFILLGTLLPYLMVRLRFFTSYFWWKIKI